MYFYVWDHATAEIFAAIKEYRRACDLFLKGNPSPELARARLEVALANLVTAILDRDATRRLHSVIDAGKEAEAEGTLPKVLDGQTVSTEIALAPNFGLKPKAVKRSLEAGPSQILEESETKITSPEALANRIEEIHTKIVAELEEIRRQQRSKEEEDKKNTRIEKKKRKRSIGQAITSALFGTGCLVGNSYLIAGMPLMTFSYAVALAAFHQSVRDIVGEPPKE